MRKTILSLLVILIFASSLVLLENKPAYAAPTRFYFANSATPSVNPAFDGWIESDGAVRRQLLAAKSASETIAVGVNHVWVSGNTQLDRQYVSDPMIAGISFSSSTIKMQLECREFALADNSVPRMSAKIVSQDGATLRQQLLAIANYGTTAEYRNGFRNVQFANGDALAGTYTTVAGDRLIIEIGHSDDLGATPHAQCRYGAPQGTADYGEDDLDTTTLVPWVEFSNTITFQTAPLQVTGLSATAASSSQINLSWTAPSDGGSPITGYKIERESPVGGGWGVLVANTGSGSTSYSDTGLDPSTQYNYRVSAINLIGTGLPSDAASTTTDQLVTPGATRFYFANSATPSVSPAFDGWIQSDATVRRQLLNAKSASETSALGTNHVWAAGANQIDRQYVSDPMNAGISFSSATIKLQLACRELADADNSVPRMSAKIVSQDGATLRQQLLAIANYGTTTEYINDPSLRNVQFANGDALAGTYTTVAGDRLVIEIGHSDNSGATPRAQCRYGAPQGIADYGENDSDIRELVPWAEFSNTITFQTAPLQVTGLSATAASSSQINLSWTAPSDGGSPITGYKIERESPVGGGWGVLVANTGSGSTSYSDTGLDPSTQYNYRVSAINLIGTGSSSNPAHVTTNPSTPGATRFYFANSATPAVSPAFDGWSESDGSVRRQLLRTDSAEESLALGTRLGWTAGNTQIDRQYVSEPMNAGISFSPTTTIKLQLACREFALADNSVPRMSAKIVSQDGATLRQQLLAIANYGTTTEYINDPSLRNVQFANGDALAGTYTTVAGDRLVIEIGHSDNSGTTPEAQCRYGAPQATTDHGENDSETATLVPWVEFSNTITFQTDGVTTSESTVSNTQRNPPRILGLGVYQFGFPKSPVQSQTTNENNHFENYYPYAINTHITDEAFYRSLGNFVKTGTFYKFEGGRASALSQIHTKPNDYFQFQVQILDEYRGSKIEHVGLYFVKPKSTETKSDTEIIWEKPDKVVILDPRHVIDRVHATTSMEDGYFWAVFDVKFRDAVDSDVVAEAWHESKMPVDAKASNLLQKLTPSEFEDRKNSVTHIARITIPNEQTSSPECKDTKSCFIPYNAYVLKDGIVIWTNDDEDFIHTITSGTPETGPDNRFNGLVHPGEIFHQTFSSIGIYPYYCMIHPWAQGIVTVVKEVPNITLDDLRSPGINVAGNVTVIKKSQLPLVLETDSSGKSILIEQNDRVALDTQKLDVKIHGFVGTRNPVGPVEITLMRPDGSVAQHIIPVGKDGKYYLPTKLAERWQTGTFQIIAKYGGKELGNMSFIIEDKQKGLGGTLKTSADSHSSILNYLESGLVDKSYLSGIGWLSVETQDPMNHNIYMLTKIIQDKTVTHDANSIKFEYYYILAFAPLIVIVLLFRNNTKK